MRRRFRPEWLAYALTAVILWCVPLFDRLHVESAAVVATVAYFVAGVALLSGRSLRSQLAAPFVAFFLLLLAAIWAPNCDWLRGAGFFVLFVPVTVLFAGGVASFVQTWTRHPRTWLVVVGVGVLVSGPVYDLAWHPQFYTYNHIFGGVLGPIYDEELVVRPGLFVFRGMTLVWSLVLWAVSDRRWRLAAAAGTVLLAAYLFPGPLGFNTPSRWLEDSYTGYIETPHFDIHFDAAAMEPGQVGRLAADHEWYWERLRRLTGIAPTTRIASYINENADARARRTGARYTSVAPVWLERPQMHLSLSSIDAVLSHELAHVFSREFGMPVLNASPLVGLVEGFAVAVEAPDGGISSTDQVAAAWTGRWGEAADRMQSALSPSGFWGGRGAVSYTTTGAFVAYLLETHGPEPFREAYASGALASAYGVPVDSLTTGWAAELGGLSQIAVGARATSRARFSVPSLFERRCPHHVPVHIARYRTAVAGQDQRALEQLVADFPDFTAARLALAATQLKDAIPAADRTLRGVPVPERSTAWHVLHAHTLAASGQFQEATDGFRSVLRRTPVSSRLQRARLAAWTHDAARDIVPDPGLLTEAHPTPQSRLDGLEGIDGQCDTSRSILSPAVCDEVYRLRSYWSMRRAVESGDLALADSVGRRTRDASAAVGDRAFSDLIDDWLARIEWMSQPG